MKPSLANKNRCTDCTVCVDSCYHNSIADVYELPKMPVRNIYREYNPLKPNNGSIWNKKTNWSEIKKIIY